MRVILADDQSVVRSALRLLLNTKTHHTIIAEAATADELITYVQTLEPDLILLDWGLPGKCPTILLEFLRERWPAIIYIVLSSQLDAQTKALQAGAAFFVSKTSLPDEVLSVLEKLSNIDESNPDFLS